MSARSSRCFVVRRRTSHFYSTQRAVSYSTNLNSVDCSILALLREWVCARCRWVETTSEVLTDSWSSIQQSLFKRLISGELGGRHELGLGPKADTLNMWYNVLPLHCWSILFTSWRYVRAGRYRRLRRRSLLLRTVLSVCLSVRLYVTLVRNA